MSIRALALIGCFLPGAFAIDILSVGKFKAEYNTKVTSEFSAANAAIEGSAEPTAANLLELWAWYRNVDAETRAEAQAFMHSNVVLPSSTMSAFADFQDKYTKDLTNTAITEKTVAAQAKKLRIILGTERPAAAAATARAAWDAYQLLDASHKTIAKDLVMLKPFIAGFTTVWDAGMKTAADYKAGVKLAGYTMAAKADAPATTTQPFWAELKEADEREALQKIMFTGAKSVSTKLL